MVGDPCKAGLVLAKHLTKATSSRAVEWAARVVGTAHEQRWVLNVCAQLEDLPGCSFELGTKVTVESTGEVVRSILTLARWKALGNEAEAMARGAARVKQLVEDLYGDENPPCNGPADACPR